MGSFPMSVANNICDYPLAKYLDSKAVLVYRPQPVLLLTEELDHVTFRIKRSNSYLQGGGQGERSLLWWPGQVSSQSRKVLEWLCKKSFKVLSSQKRGESKLVSVQPSVYNRACFM
jgi:hypothetical protein